MESRIDVPRVVSAAQRVFLCLLFGVVPTGFHDSRPRASGRAEGTATLPGVFVTVQGQEVRLNSVSNAHETQD
jgi:hypothetical protein